MRLRRLASLTLFFCLFVLAGVAAAQPTLLLQQPALGQDRIVFAHAGELWTVGVNGGNAARLTSFPGVAARPRVSPDGRTVAFSGRYRGQTDVYVIPIDGGQARRLTWHPGADEVQGWSPDGRAVVFASNRDSAPAGYARFWEVSTNGGMPAPLVIPRGQVGRHSPDGRQFVYQPIRRWQDHWRNYRGGQVHPIWIIDLESYNHREIPWNGTIDTDPVWIGDTIYFLSDRSGGVVNVFAYDNAGTPRQLTHHRDFDVKALDARGSRLVYEQGGRLHAIDLQGGTHRALDVTVTGDMPWLQTQWRDVGGNIMNAALSPTGVRAVFEARGDIFTVPAQHGNWRNITRTSGSADRYPAWSPDGTRIAWFSDRSGEYQLLVGPQDGIGEVRAFDMPRPSFYMNPMWSPDSRHILFSDADRNLWVMQVENGAIRRVDNDLYATPEHSLYPSWSPDSRWIAYGKRMDNQMRTIIAWSLDSGRSTAVTDGMADAIMPRWDRSGKYLYFLASTNYGLNTGWLDMSSYERPADRGLYLAVLSREDLSPLLPKSDEEGAAEAGGGNAEGNAGGSAGDVRVRIDFDGIDQRILAVNVPVRNYTGLATGKNGVLFLSESIPNQPGATVHRYTLEEREMKSYLDGVTRLELSQDGEKALYQARGQWAIVGTGGAPAAGDGRLDVGGLRMEVDPRAEWRQLFDDVWRLNRDYLYVENFHGLDWNEMREIYAPMLDAVAHRADLNYLLALLVGELALGHTYVGGGDVPDGEGAGTGLLGVDFEIADGRYRFARIFDGESWNPDLNAPLRAPGLNVNRGDYLLAVDGVSLTAHMNPLQLFEGTVGRQVRLLINDRPATTGAREVTVVPIGNEAGLRLRAWVEDNRRRVDEASGGRLAYVYLPNTGWGGYTYFNRYFFAQQDREGAVIDERFNGGGSAADYIVDVLARDLHGFFNNPIGERRPFTSPGAGIWGPKVMIINEAAGSGGDLLPYMFRKMGIGPLIGTRTWGGLVGIWDTPPLTDGGFVRVPRGGFFDLEGRWAVENEGVAPDFEVIQTPREVIMGRDPQLERAIQEAMRRLPSESPVLPEPSPPVRTPRR
jgi:tricorn protease